MSNDHRKKCKHCKHTIEEVNFALGKQWMHVDESASYPTVAKGTMWMSCKIFVAEPISDEDKCKDQLAHNVARKSGLDAMTCLSLLDHGWRYVEAVNEVSRWEHPMWQVEDRVISTPSMYEVLSKPLND